MQERWGGGEVEERGGQVRGRWECSKKNLYTIIVEQKLSKDLLSLTATLVVPRAVVETVSRSLVMELRLSCSAM